MALCNGSTEADRTRGSLALDALAILTLTVLLATWAGPARAANLEWSGDCTGNTNWYATCTVGECSPGVGKVFNNWGQWACAPGQPTFPGSGDTVTLNAVAGLNNDATVGSLSLGAGAVLDAVWDHSRLVVETTFTNQGELKLYESGTLVPWGTVTNNGMISMEWGGNYGNGIIEVPTAVTLQGTGQILFALSTGPQTIVGAGPLTQAAGHTIHGGHGAVDVALVNQSLVDADVDGGTIMLRAAAKTNQALLRASNGGTLEITAAVTQQGAGQIEASGANSRVTLVGGGQVTGGTLSGTGGGTVTVERLGDRQRRHRQRVVEGGAGRHPQRRRHHLDRQRLGGHGLGHPERQRPGDGRRHRRGHPGRTLRLVDPWRRPGQRRQPHHPRLR